MKAIIIAAGKGERWGNYLGVPKQLIPIKGEPILYRTIRQLKERGIKDISVTMTKKGQFGKLDAKEIIGSSATEMDKFLNTEKAVKTNAILFWGDTYFTDKAMDTILADKNDFRFFGREGASITGKRYGEIFAVKVNKMVLEKAKELTEKLKVGRCATWELYRYINGYPLREHKVEANFTEINDLTDDFDYPEDYDKWIKCKTVSYNIMAHPSRKEYIPYLLEELGEDTPVIWDKVGSIWETRTRCLQNHIEQGCDYCITVQDDAILAKDFKAKAEAFINRTNKEALYNFYYRDKNPDHEKRTGVEKGVIIKNRLQNEICFAMPTKYAKDLIEEGNKINSKDDAVIISFFAKRLWTHFCIPSLIDHRKGFSLSMGRSYENRHAFWFEGHPVPKYGIMNKEAPVMRVYDNVLSPTTFQIPKTTPAPLQKNSNLSFVVIVRMEYKDEDKLKKRLEIFKKTTLRCLRNQRYKNFDIAVRCYPKHNKLFTDLGLKTFQVAEGKESKKNSVGYFYSRVEWKDVIGLDQYDIQSSLDSDDIITPDYTQRIIDEVTQAIEDGHDRIYIHFQPELFDPKTFDVKKMNIRYSDNRGSMFYSYYQSGGDYVFINHTSHTLFPVFGRKKILIPEGYCYLTIWGDNDSSHMGL